MKNARMALKTLRSSTCLKSASASLALLFVLTPAVLRAAAKPKPAVTHWIATWSTSPSPAGADDAMRRRRLEFNEQTLREIVHITLGGDRFRVRLSNAFGTKAVTIGGAHLAIRGAGSKIVPESDRALAFSGRPGIAIPPGAVVLSDPVDLKAPDSADLAVSVYLPGGPTIPSTLHYSAMQTSYLAPGDATGTVEMPETPSLSTWPFLTGVDVVAPLDCATVVALGDSITDGARSTNDANRRWPNILANRLLALKTKTRLAVVNAGIGGGRILHDGYGPQNGPQYGPSALARYERDVLAQPGVKYVIVLEGVNDIGHPGPTPGASAPMSEDVTADDMIAGYKQLIERAHERGIKVFGSTIMPFPTQAPKEAKRQAVNQWIRSSNAFDAVIDFDKVVGDPAQPGRFLAAYDSGDHLHPNDAGHKAMGEVIDLSLFSR
jgi:lysophospholipase L1-like esterase